MSGHAPTPWFVSGVRFRMNGGEWQSINRYDEVTKQDENVACVGYDPRTGLGQSDAHFIVKAVNSHDALVKALETIRDAFWRDGETCDERIADLKTIARNVLALTHQQPGSPA